MHKAFNGQRGRIGEGGFSAKSATTAIFGGFLAKF
jgi:hypothetical protein